MTGMTYSGRPVTEGVEFVKVPRADGRGAATRLTRENARTVKVVTMGDDTVTLRHKRNGRDGRLTTIRADKFKAWLDKNFDVWLDEVEAAWDREEREREAARAAEIATARKEADSFVAEVDQMVEDGSIYAFVTDLRDRLDEAEAALDESRSYITDLRYRLLNAEATLD